MNYFEFNAGSLERVLPEHERKRIEFALEQERIQRVIQRLNKRHAQHHLVRALIERLSQQERS